MGDVAGPAIDRATFEGMLDAVGGDPEFLAELVDAFVADIPAQLEAMRSGAAGGEAETVTRAAHTLKSSSASLGALALAEACRALEAQARGGDLVDADEHIARVETLAQVATAELQSLVAAA